MLSNTEPGKEVSQLKRPEKEEAPPPVGREWCPRLDSLLSTETAKPGEGGCGPVPELMQPQWVCSHQRRCRVPPYGQVSSAGLPRAGGRAVNKDNDE